MCVCVLGECILEWGAAAFPEAAPQLHIEGVGLGEGEEAKKQWEGLREGGKEEIGYGLWAFSGVLM